MFTEKVYFLLVRKEYTRCYRMSKKYVDLYTN